MARLALQILALSLGAAVAVGLVSCGSRDTKGLLPGNNAQQIQQNLSSVDQLASQGDCSGAAGAVSEVQSEIDALPSSVDPQLRDRLRAGAARLADVVNAPGACETTSAPTSTPTSTEQTTTQKQKTKSTTTSTTTTTSTQPTTPATTPTTPTTPGTSTGGTPGAGGGVVPPGQQRHGDRQTGNQGGN